ncbi:hypothetical protein [Streptomyces sp. NPDC007984]|uniref:hypothetical protein n=1 Tax=Streptomyces sp. NPDC007984 TaxID=3364801 RepID=UPI0036EF51DD
MDRRKFLSSSVGAAGAVCLGGTVALGTTSSASADDGRLSQWYLTKEDDINFDAEEGYDWTHECQGVARAWYGDPATGEPWWWVVSNADSGSSYKGIHKLDFAWRCVDHLTYEESWWPHGNHNDHIGAVHANEHNQSDRGGRHVRLYVPVEHGSPRVWVTSAFGAADKHPGKMFFLGTDALRPQQQAAWCSTDLSDSRVVTPDLNVIGGAPRSGGYLYSSNSTDDRIYGYHWSADDNPAGPRQGTPDSGMGALRVGRISRLPFPIEKITGGFVKDGRLYLSDDAEPGHIFCFRFAARAPGRMYDSAAMVLEGTYSIDEAKDTWPFPASVTEVEGLCHAPVDWHDEDDNHSRVTLILLDNAAFRDDVSVLHYDMPAEQAP